MKRFAFICLLPIIFLLSTSMIIAQIDNDEGLDKENCTFNGIKLIGRVKIVDAGEDFRVRIVGLTGGEDMLVEKVDNISTYSTCCQWQFVDCLEDFKIKIVGLTGGEDFKIKFKNP